MRAIHITIPLLLAITLIEFLASRARGRDSYELRDSLGNVGCGLLEQVAGLALYPVLFAVYYALEQNAILTMPTGAVWSWIAALLLSDLAFYLFHRSAHRVNAIWATHIVHHQSSRFNYTVAMRNAAFQRLFACWFYWPLAIIGIPSTLLLGALAVSLLYQFLLHTRFFPTLGPLDWVLNTPSHHRVHHGTEPEYLDRNFGAILIVWDRLFGTFAAERQEPTYGVCNQSLRTSNPVWANVVYWTWLVKLCRAGRAKWSKIWFAAPAHTAEGERNETD